MDTLLGFHVSGWDYLTFLVIFIIGGVALVKWCECYIFQKSNGWRCQMSHAAIAATTVFEDVLPCWRFRDGNAWRLRSC